MSWWDLIDVCFLAWLFWENKKAEKDMNFWKDKYYEEAFKSAR